MASWDDQMFTKELLYLILFCNVEFMIIWSIFEMCKSKKDTLL